MNKIDFSALMQPEYTEVEVPELGGTVRIKKMQAREYIEIEKLYMEKSKIKKDKDGNDVFSIAPTEVEAAFVRLCIVDDKNNHVFDEKTVWQLDKQILSALHAVIKGYTDKLSQQEVENAAKK